MTAAIHLEATIPVAERNLHGDLVVPAHAIGVAAFAHDLQQARITTLLLDPAKVTRSALQHAASIASLILTTDAMIAEHPHKNVEAMPATSEM